MSTIAKSQQACASAATERYVDSDAASATTPLRTLTEEASGRSGTVRVTLRRDARGLFLEREEEPAHGPRVLLVASFVDLSTFAQWSENDPLRFDAPILHKRIRQDAETLWSEAA